MGILDEIIKDKKAEIELGKSKTTIKQFKTQIAPLPKCRNFYKAVTKRNPRGINVIAEIKKASPSSGIICKNFDPIAIAQTYQSCGADAISILTDEKHFQGRIEHITKIKQLINLPMLRKDFIIDPWQVYESRAAGADAVLLIAEVLTTSQLSDLMILAAELTLTVLLEVHRADTLLSVRSFVGFPQKGYSVLGINNRDIATMKVDLATTSRLAELVENKEELVSESGIKNRDNVEKLKSLGIGAVLVGQALCESNDIAAKFKELFG